MPVLLSIPGLPTGDLSILVDCFLDVYRESTAHQLACVLIINEILEGHWGRKGTEGGTASSESSREDVVRYRTL